MPRADRPQVWTPERVVQAIPRDTWLTAAQIGAYVSMNQSALNARLCEACARGLMQRRPKPDNQRGYIYLRIDTLFSGRRPTMPYPQVLYGPGVPDAAMQIGKELCSLWALNARTK